jgi:hypothetical protein
VEGDAFPRDVDMIPPSLAAQQLHQVGLTRIQNLPEEPWILAKNKHRSSLFTKKRPGRNGKGVVVIWYLMMLIVDMLELVLLVYT